MPRKAGQTYARAWCFTVNNYDEDDESYCCGLFADDENCKYLIIGWEKADRTGTPHLQCFIYYTNEVSWSTMKTRLEPWHFEKANDITAAYCYCMEDGDYLEFGTRPRQGHRTDLEVIKNDLLHQKKTLKDISLTYFAQFCQYHRSFDRFIQVHELDKVKYETKFVVYDDTTVHRIYKEYPYKQSLILKSCYEISPIAVLHEYYSGNYKYVFYPMIRGHILDDSLDQILDHTLY